MHLKQDKEQEEQKWDDKAGQILNQFINGLQSQEKKLLPNKKRCVLEVAEYILQKQKEDNKDELKSDLYQKLLNCFQTPNINKERIVDFYTFAQQWLTRLTPYLQEKRQREKRKIISLNDLKQDYAQIVLTSEIMEQILSSVPDKPSLKLNIASCILGVPEND